MQAGKRPPQPMREFGPSPPEQCPVASRAMPQTYLSQKRERSLNQGHKCRFQRTLWSRSTSATFQIIVVRVPSLFFFYKKETTCQLITAWCGTFSKFGSYLIRNYSNRGSVRVIITARMVLTWRLLRAEEDCDSRYSNSVIKCFWPFSFLRYQLDFRDGATFLYVFVTLNRKECT